jgi:TolB-like protein/Tfp pilus assembly protein PilF
MENPDSEEYCAECGTKLESEKKPGGVSPTPAQIPQEALAVGSTFGLQYKVLEFLGQGSAGKIYKVYDQAMERDLALRLISPEIAGDKGALERFRNELKALRRLVHKNVARAFDFKEEKGAPYYTMEFVPGSDLKALIQQAKRLPPDKIISIVQQVCRGLSEAHRLGLIHLGLKPANIRIESDGTAKIMDLGITSSFYPKGVSATGVMVGVPEYMCPEQLEGKDLDQRSDIYSLGTILYEMATGQPPFTGVTHSEISQKHQKEIPKNPPDLNPQITPKLGLLILKCLEKDRDKRYQTAEEVRLDLEEVGRGGQPAAEREAPVVPPVRPEKKPAPAKPVAVTKPKTRLDLKRLLVPALGAVGVVVLAFAIWQLFLSPSKKATAPADKANKPSIAILAFEDSSPAKDHEYLGDGMAEILIDALTDIHGLCVPARTSAFYFKGKGLDGSGIGQKLGVDQVLETKFQISADTLRVGAKLIKSKDGSIIWSKEFDQNLADIFSIQREIAQEIVRLLKIESLLKAGTALIKDYTANPDAFDLYCQASFLQRKGGRLNLEKAVEGFEKAAEKDPSFARAYARLAGTCAALGNDSFWPPDKAFPAAKEAVLKALRLDPALAEAQSLLAMIKANFDWDFAAAEKGYRESIMTKPSSATTHRLYARLLSVLGRHEEAFQEIELARTLDPFSSGINADAGAILYFARQYDQAREELRKALALDPLYRETHYYWGLISIQMERYEEALLSFRRARELGGDPLQADLRIAYVYALQARRQEAGKILAEALRVSKQTFVPSVSMAAVYAGVAEKDQVFACLDKAVADRDIELLFLKVLPLFDSVRLDARFTRLLRRIGLEKGA